MIELRENEAVIQWSKKISGGIMSDENWNNYPRLINENKEIIICHEDHVDKRQNNMSLLQPTSYFISDSFGSWSKDFNKINKCYPAQYDLKDGDGVWAYKIQTYLFVPIGFEIVVPYNFIREKDYFGKDYANKYGRIVALRYRTSQNGGSLTLGHIIAVDNETEKVYGETMVVVRTYGYGYLTEDTDESGLFRKYIVKGHYHYASYYHNILDMNNYDNDDHVKNCLRCNDCYHEIGKVIKEKKSLDMPLRTIVDGITKKSMEIDFSKMMKFIPKSLKKLVEKWYLKYNTFQFIVKVLTNLRHLDDGTFWLDEGDRYKIYLNSHEIIRRFNYIINGNLNFYKKDVYKCIWCSANLFKSSDVDCFTSEGSISFRINRYGILYQIRTFKNCISNKVFACGLPHPGMNIYHGYKCRDLFCCRCGFYIGWRFESRIYKPSIFYGVIDRCIYTSYYGRTYEDVLKIVERNTTLPNYLIREDNKFYDLEGISVFDEVDFKF